jgi:hypothetical protein
VLPYVELRDKDGFHYGGNEQGSPNATGRGGHGCGQMETTTFPASAIKEVALVEHAREDRATLTNAPATTAHSARCASREAIQHLTAGIRMMRTMS